MIASLVFLTPLGAIVAVVAAVPLAALALVARRERRAARLLGLPAPAPRLMPALALAAVVALLAVAAAQPALRSQTSQAVRTDAQAIFVLDISRSMLAARTRRAPTRLARARAEAVRLRDALPQIPSGVATLTDRVLPDLLPSPSLAIFTQTVREAVGINSPPPQSTAPTITSLGALGALGTQDFFAPAARHRLVIVFTDGETRPFDVQATARALGRSPGVKTIFVHVWSADETVFGSNGQPEHGYHPDPGSGQALSTLAQATGGSSIGEGALGSAARLARAALGSGPTTMEGLTLRTRPLAPWLALASLLPLFVRLGGPPLRRLAGRRPAAESKSPSRAGETALGSAGGSG